MLGSGLGAFANKITNPCVIDYADVPGWPESSVKGHAGNLILGFIGDVPVMVMQGRVHYYEGYTMEETTFPIRVLHQLGCSHAIMTNAAGCINPDWNAGDIMLITDHINVSQPNPCIGPNDERLGPRFFDMSDAYTREYHDLVRTVASVCKVDLREGVYCGVSGPSYETPSEIRMMRTMGGSAVGMSTVAEVIVAVHSGIRVVGISLLTNMAAGVSDEVLNHEDVQAIGKLRADVMVDLLTLLVGKLSDVMDGKKEQLGVRATFGVPYKVDDE